jgi:transposase
MNRWESEGVVGLYNKPGRGTPSKLNEPQKQKIREWAKQQPRQLKQVVQKVKEEWGITVSSKTIKRILKKNTFARIQESEPISGGFRPQTQLKTAKLKI